MSEICKICGSEKIEGKCPNAESHLKKMCINCISCDCTSEGEHFCANEQNLSDAVEKLKANVPPGYAIENVELKPLALKDITKKCKRWSIDKQKVLDEFDALV